MISLHLIALRIRARLCSFFINLITALNYYTATDYFRLQNKSLTEIYIFRLYVNHKNN